MLLCVITVAKYLLPTNSDPMIETSHKVPTIFPVLIPSVHNAHLTHHTNLINV